MVHAVKLAPIFKTVWSNPLFKPNNLALGLCRESYQLGHLPKQTIITNWAFKAKYMDKFSYNIRLFWIMFPSQSGCYNIM